MSVQAPRRETGEFAQRLPHSGATTRKKFLTYERNFGGAKGFEPLRKPRSLTFSHRNVSGSGCFGTVCPTWGKLAGTVDARESIMSFLTDVVLPTRSWPGRCHQEGTVGHPDYFCARNPTNRSSPNRMAPKVILPIRNQSRKP
jgi:hypothetical protein